MDMFTEHIRNSISHLPPTNVPQISRGIDVERVKRARAQRQAQLRKWEEFDSRQSYNSAAIKHYGKDNSRSVKFNNNLVLPEAAARGDFAEVRQLLAKNVNPNVASEDGLTALHQCCIDDRLEMCNLLLQHGADVNVRDAELWTPLHAAATCGYQAICQLLIRNGADLLAVNADGNMPYDICEDEPTLTYIESEMAAQNITQEQIDEVRLIPERTMLMDMQRLSATGQDLNALDNQGAAPLHVAAACGYQEVVHYLLQLGVDPHQRDADGWQAAHVAACWGQPEVLELLVAYGADLNAKTPTGQNVFNIGAAGEMYDRVHEIWSNRENLRALASQQQQTDFHRTRTLNRRRSTKSVQRSSTRYKESLSRRDAEQEAALALAAAEANLDVLSPNLDSESPAQGRHEKVVNHTSDRPNHVKLSYNSREGDTPESSPENMSVPNQLPAGRKPRVQLIQMQASPIDSPSSETEESPRSILPERTRKTTNLPLTVTDGSRPGLESTSDEARTTLLNGNQFTELTILPPKSSQQINKTSPNSGAESPQSKVRLETPGKYSSSKLLENPRGADKVLLERNFPKENIVTIDQPKIMAIKQQTSVNESTTSSKFDDCCRNCTLL